MKLIITLFFLLITIIIAVLYRKNIKEYFVAQISKSYDTNEFKTIVLDKMNNYDIELAVPSGQYLYNTTQGNWGFSTDETNNGVVFGIYRDGYTADGSIFKGKSGKRFKHILEQGPYVIRYEVRKNKDTDDHDVSIFVDDKLVKIAESEGISSDKIKVIGTNYHNYNNEAKKDERGRRPVDYLKFIPKDVNGKSVENFTSSGEHSKEKGKDANVVEEEKTLLRQILSELKKENNNSENNKDNNNSGNNEEDVNFIIELKKINNLKGTDLSVSQYISKMCKEEGLFCNKIEDISIDTQTGEFNYNSTMYENEPSSKSEDNKNELKDTDFVKDLFKSIDKDNDGILTIYDIKTLMMQLNLDIQINNEIIGNLKEPGMNYRDFNFILGEHIDRIFKNVYSKNGEPGVKLVYKIWGYEYPHIRSKEDNGNKKKKDKIREQWSDQLKKMYPETDYDKSQPSKTRYRSDYKPQHPRPEKGVHFYDSIWDFTKK